eukprot:4270198-Lingulodinium_polyedra.AAC.1
MVSIDLSRLWRSSLIGRDPSGLVSGAAAGPPLYTARAAHALWAHWRPPENPRPSDEGGTPSPGRELQQTMRDAPRRHLLRLRLLPDFPELHLEVRQIDDGAHRVEK